MKTTIRHIEYLLSRNDCVIIPGLGAILATTVSAKYDPLTHTILPPSRSYIFNPDIRHNDGILITSVQQATQMSYEAARHSVNMAVDQIISALDKGEYVEIGIFGNLKRSADSASVTFISNVDVPSADTLWLKPIRLRSVATESSRVIDAPIVRESASVFSSWVRAAAIVCLVLLGITISTPVSVENAVTLASLAPEFTQIPAEEFLPKPPVAASAADAAPVDTDGRQAAESATLTEAVPEAASAAPVAEETYYVIVASLISDSEAELFMQMHPCQQLQILKGGKYTRVYLSAHDNPEGARIANQQASKTYPGSWVLKQ